MALGLTFTVLLPKFLYFSAVSCEGKLTVVDEALPAENGKPDLASVRALLGRVKMPDGVAYEQELRSEWESRG